ncbi:MAG: N,N-dimethylformamidase large subunit, partial [Chromatiales bacterium]|nr:N,N-dimethylformamidase large subunit [Chromatiales bacterium]
MLPLAAYANRLSVRPGETIRFHVANATDANTTAKIVRVICADANPAGPGIVLSRIDAEPVKLLEPGPQSVPHGSHVRIAGLDRWISGDSFTMVCRVFPTLRSDRDQCIFASNTAQGGFSVSVQADGTLAARTGTGTGVTHAASRPLALRQWHVVWLRHDAAQGRLQLGHARLDTSMMRDPSSSLVEGATGEASLSGRDGTLLLAASGVDAPRDHFNGKLEAPALWDRALLDEELSALAVGAEVAGAVAAWDFAHQADTDRIIDRGSWKLEGVAINTPSRAVTGSTWTGKEMCFRNAPQQYSAIHFHEDDIDDCRWPAAFEWTVPDDTRSAVYALLLEAGVATENVPFHVVPPRGKSTARLAVLASTITYTIYGNHARPEWLNDAQWKADWEQQVSDWGCYPHNPGAHREYGLSTYNMHPDGSGISIASWHRPMLNVRIGFLTYPYPSIRASGLRHFPADSHLIAWLESRDIAYDVITDWELHEEGQALLDHYDVVLTGSHPEYHTPAMIDSLTGYRDGGGRLCYLGGNGFYWKVALAGDRTGVIEIRRGEGGIRAWAAEPG